MGLFFDVLSAINNPDTEGSVDQLGQVMNTIQQVSRDNGIGDSQMKEVLSGLGGVLPSVLRQQGINPNTSGSNDILGQLTAGQAGGGGIGSLLTGSVSQQIVQQLSQRTSLDAGTLQGIVPTLVPAVLSLLKMGKTHSGMSGGNPLLNAFLDADKDGDVDLGDVFILANRFLNARRV